MTKVSLLISYPLSKICRRTPQSVLLFEHCFLISYKNKSPCIQLDIIMTNIRRSREQCKRACSIGIAEAPPDMRRSRIYAEAESNANELARLALPRRHRICGHAEYTQKPRAMPIEQARFGFASAWLGHCGDFTNASPRP